MFATAESVFLLEMVRLLIELGGTPLYLEYDGLICAFPTEISLDQQKLLNEKLNNFSLSTIDFPMGFEWSQ